MVSPTQPVSCPVKCHVDCEVGRLHCENVHRPYWDWTHDPTRCEMVRTSLDRMLAGVRNRK